MVAEWHIGARRAVARPGGTRLSRRVAPMRRAIDLRTPTRDDQALRGPLAAARQAENFVTSRGNRELPHVAGDDAVAPIFEVGPLSLLAWRSPPQSDAQAWRRAAIVALAAWLPLPMLALATDGFGPVTWSVMTDAGLHFRLLIALPALVYADRFCGQRLTAIAHEFAAAGMIVHDSQPRFDALLARARGACRSRVAGGAILAIAYAAVVAALAAAPDEWLPAWQRGVSAGLRSPLMWRHVLVSAPAVLALLLGWLWRWAIWFRLLVGIARLPLRLCAPHPDHCAGLQFVGHSVRAMTPLGLAMGAALAGRVANEAWHTHVAVESFQLSGAGLLITVVVVCCLPLFAFSGQLLREWRHGVFHYGRLASRMGARFDEKWIRGAPPIEADVLDATDFSAAIDLSSYVANVYDMHLTLLDLRSLVVLVAAVALPFLPVVLTTAPLDVLLKDLVGMLV
jgi:hypothetical protein